MLACRVGSGPPLVHGVALGGHGAGADNRQAARFLALSYAFLAKELK